MTFSDGLQSLELQIFLLISTTHLLILVVWAILSVFLTSQMLAGHTLFFIITPLCICMCVHIIYYACLCCRRGLAAVRDLTKGELILRVPEEALFTTQSVVLKDHTFSVALQQYQSLSSTQVFVLFFAYYL